MKCPHCNYVYGLSERSTFVEGDSGDFFSTKLKVKRDAKEYYCTIKEEAFIYACPKCKILFINQ